LVGFIYGALDRSKGVTPKKPSVPTAEFIDAAALLDDQVLWSFIDALLRADRQLVAQHRAILLRQAELQRRSPSRAWKAYLQVEEIINKRHTSALLHVGRELLWCGYRLGLRTAAKAKKGRKK
jgi:hypothetical protein